jgi:hypothetical protein
MGFAQDLRAGQTDAEIRLWYELRGRRFMGLKFKRQKPRERGGGEGDRIQEPPTKPSPKRHPKNGIPETHENPETSNPHKKPNLPADHRPPNPCPQRHQQI